MKGAPSTHGGFDLQTMREAFKGPGMDTRQWCSYGTVEPETPEAPSVDFDRDYGPLVNVKLHPSALHVRCRVAMFGAGNGEAEYHPFVEGDEVLVLVPEGDERAGCAIVGRLNNQIDKFPRRVGGQNVAKNNVAFKRVKPPYVMEVGSSYLLTSVSTGAFMVLGQDGNFTLKEGSGNFIHCGADFIGMQTGDGSTYMQIVDEHIIGLPAVPGKHAFLVKVDGATSLELAASKSGLATSGSFYVGTFGQRVTEHVVSVEAVLNLFQTVLTALGAVLPTVNAVTVHTAILAAIPVSVASVIPTDIMLALRAALTAKNTHPNITGNTPGVGCPGFLTG